MSTPNSTGSAVVTVVGAGPVGLFTALLLGKAGIDVAVFEREGDVVQSPRALGYTEMVLREFAKTGILKDVEDEARHATDGVAWRDAKGNTLAFLGLPPGSPAKYMSLMMGQHEIAKIILKHLTSLPNAKVFWNHTFTRLEQTEDGVTAFFEHGSEKSLVRYKSRFLVGSDGGRSTVRRFLNIPFEGFTWDDFKFHSANIVYDLEKYGGWSAVNYVIDPEDWAVVLRAGKREKFWRVAYGERYTPETDAQPFDPEAAMVRAREKFRRMLPGPTEEVVFERIAPYTTHQRCAARLVEGNVILAGDSSHLNNPVGGLGLTTGFLDAAALGETLIKIINGGENAEVALKAYNDSRRDAFLSYTNPISIQNRQRLYFTTKEAVEERDHHVKMISEKNIPYIVNMLKKEHSISTTGHTNQAGGQ